MGTTYSATPACGDCFSLKPPQAPIHCLSDYHQNSSIELHLYLSISSSIELSMGLLDNLPFYDRHEGALIEGLRVCLPPRHIFHQTALMSEGRF